MGFLSILTGSAKELYKRPVLFLPKMISVTFWLVPYILLLEQSKADLAAGTVSMEMLFYTALIFLLSPVWLVIDSMYPILVKQLRSKKKKLDFKKALMEVLSKFWRILAVFLIILFVMVVLTLPPTFLLSLGIVTGFFPLLSMGMVLLFVLVVALSILLYFVPTTIVLEKTGVAGAFKSGFGLTKKNFSLVTLLSVFSLAFFALAFLFEGEAEVFGLVGFILARYLGGIFTVYLYIVNPSAYFEVKR